MKEEVGSYMKQCPFCSGEVQDEAIKCRHCRKMLDGSTPPSLQSQPAQILNDAIKSAKDRASEVANQAPEKLARAVTPIISRIRDGIAAGAAQAATQQVRQVDPATRLRKLQELHAAGVITDSDYEQQKARILSEI